MQLEGHKSALISPWAYCPGLAILGSALGKEIGVCILEVSADCDSTQKRLFAVF